MKINKNSIYSFFAVICILFLAGCSEDKMDDINKDVNHVNDVKAKFILTDVITATAFTQIGGDMNSYLSIYVEQEVGIDNQFNRAETRTGEPSSASTFNNVWVSAYRKVKDAKIAIAKCSEGGDEEGNDVTLGIAQVLLAYNGAFLTDMFGDTPWSEAGDYAAYMNPQADKQENIYKNIISLLDDAIKNFEKSDINPMDGQDYIYGGDKNKWKKAAYGLKARYLMRLINRTTTLEADMNLILECIEKSFSDRSEQLAYNMYSGANRNPMFAAFQSREGIAASKSLYEKLNERNDPRVQTCFIVPKTGVVVNDSNKDELLLLADNGNPVATKLLHNNSIFVASQSAATYLLSYHEILFLKAEALYHLGRLPEAKAALKEAVVAGILNAQYNIQQAKASEFWTITTTSPDMDTQIATDYFDSKVAPLFDANPLKELMIQKYLAFWGANGESVETYNDVRRMKAKGLDFYGLRNSNNFPLRCPYGVSDTSANPNIEKLYGDGKYVYTENVWWANGTR